MTTKNSPLHVLKAQADRIAGALKRAERGEAIASGALAHAGKITDARNAKENVKFAVAMDDKIIAIEMPWTTIRNTEEAALSEYIVKQMSEARHA